MPELAFLQPLWDWLGHNQDLVSTVAIASVIVLVVQLLSIPLIIAALPANYFSTKQRVTPRWLSRHPAVHLLLRIAANVLGVLFIGLGILMIFTPGQGILSILVGVGLTDFPGKHELERRLAARRHVLNSMNWLRRHLNRPPLEKPHISGAGG